MTVTIRKKLYIGFLVTILITVVTMKALSAVIGEVSSLGSMIARDLIIGGLSITVAFLIAVLISQRITRQLRSLAAVARVISEGDLTRTVAVTVDDEVGELAASFEQMVTSLRAIVREVKATAEAVTQSATVLSGSADQMSVSTEEIAGTVEQIAKGAEQQASLVERTSRVIKEMATSINEIAARAKSAADAASEAGYTAQTGGKSVKEAMNRMKELFGIIESSTLGVKGFTERTAQIGTIVDVITKIAQQTHLLALNATIEAARAGEYGKGFTVVAEEIRKLATEAATSAEKITAIIKEIQGESTRVISAMEVATREVNAGKDVLSYTGEALEDIVRVVVGEVNKVQEISSLTQRQIQGAEELVKTVDEIAKVAEDNAASTEEASAATTEQTAAMEQMAASAQKLSALSGTLRSLVTHFKVDSENGNARTR